MKQQAGGARKHPADKKGEKQSMRTKRVAGLVLALVVAAAVTVSGCSPGGKKAAEPQYPTRQIEYVVPAAAGGSTDLVARAVAEYVSKKWGKPVTVVNKPGGGCAVGAQYALQQAKPDGYTVFADVHSASSMMVAGMKNPPVKLEDRVFVSRLILDPICFAVKADAPWKTFQEFTEWVKAHPDQLSWATVGPAGLSAFGVCDWLAAIGVDPAKTRMVVTDGASDSLTKLAGGHVVLACHTVAECYTLAQAGKIRVLAVEADQRSPYMPDVPTTDEAGVPGLHVKWWTGVSVPKGTPDYVVQKWAQTLQEMVKDPAFVQQAEKLHVGISYLGPQDFKDFVYREAEFYTQLASFIGLRK